MRLQVAEDVEVWIRRQGAYVLVLAELDEAEATAFLRACHWRREVAARLVRERLQAVLDERINDPMKSRKDHACDETQRTAPAPP